MEPSRDVSGLFDALDDEVLGILLFDSDSENDNPPSPVTTDSANSTHDTQNGSMNEQVRNGRRKLPRPSPVEHSTELLLDVVVGKRQRLGRARSQAPILYAFPSYDKCDSLLYFPNTLVRLVNSSDYARLSRLLVGNLDRCCQMFNNSNKESKMVPVRSLVGTFQLMNDMHPDRIMCVHGTQVERNTITATIYSKFTSCRVITESKHGHHGHHSSTGTRHHGTDHGHQRAPPRSHDEAFSQQIQHETMISDERRANILQMVRDRADMLVYAKLTMAVTYDDTTKKVVRMVFDQHVTSVERTDFHSS